MFGPLPYLQFRIFLLNLYHNEEVNTMAKQPTYQSYEVFNIFDSETHEWWKGLTREQLAGFVLGTYRKRYWNSYQPAVHKIQQEIHCPDGVFYQGFEQH